MLISPPGELRLVASSSEAMEVVELSSCSHQGPCLEAFRTGEGTREPSIRIPALAPVLQCGSCRRVSIGVRAAASSAG